MSRPPSIWPRAALVAALGLCLLAPPGFGTAEARTTAPDEAGRAEPLPGVALAEALATATGIAITPLLGVSAVGAWKAYRTPPELRGQLPWYASTWFWVPGLAIALLLVFKDPLLGLVPAAKKPLDAVDVVENKVSAVLAAPAVLPMFVTAAASARGLLEAGEEAPAVSAAGLVALPGFVGELPEMLLLGVGAALFLAAFFCVWLAFHAINVLILLSPFGPLDLLLRAVKLAVLAVLAAATLIHPYLGALVALAIVAVSIPLAAWSFRLTVFGGVLALDLATWAHRRVRTDRPWMRAFVADRLAGLPGRTCGRLSRTEEGLSFSYRRWLVLPRRSVLLPAGRYDLGRGMVCPVVRLRPDGKAPLEVLRLPPRYRYHEEEIVGRFELSGVEDLGLRRGVKAVIRFVGEMAGRGAGGEAQLPGRVGDSPGG